MRDKNGCHKAWDGETDEYDEYEKAANPEFDNDGWGKPSDQNTLQSKTVRQKDGTMKRFYRVNPMSFGDITEGGNL